MRYVVLAPWKMARGPYSDLSQQYIERIARYTPVEFVFPSSPLSSDTDVNTFLLRELKKLATDHFALICLDENGKTFDSVRFAQRLSEFENQARKGVCFCFGSAHGLPAGLAELSGLELVSMSPFTMAHELAMVVLLEQVYRAKCILTKHPYHHGAKSDLAKVLKK